jgi:regulator of sigma E protease
MDNLIAIISTLIVLGIMIVVHELGHHLVAKWFGVRVEIFSVGFGKRLFGKVWHGTDYRLSALPFGGYVKMAGMDAVESKIESRTDDPGEFLNHPRWQRVLIAVAGPAMNILLAIAILTGVFMVRYEHEATLDAPAVIGFVQPDSPAAKAGIQIGDRIVRFDNVNSPVWEDVLLKSMLNARNPIDVTVQRGEQVLRKSVVPEPKGKEEAGAIGVYPAKPILVEKLEPGLPAEKAGLQPGDELIAANGTVLRSIEQFQSLLQQNGDKPVNVTVRRGEQTLSTAASPIYDEPRPGFGKVWRIGFQAKSPVHVDKLPFGKAFARSVEQNKKFSFLIIELLQKMVQRKVSMKQVDGPLRIGQAVGQAVQQPGWTAILALMAMISLNLGIFNLLPIPILDGGLILLTTIEGLIRRDISQRLKERIYQTAFVFLVIFAAFILFNDVTKMMGS